jgi:hypothetical protein
MPKKADIPEVLPVTPISAISPLFRAEPNHDYSASRSGFGLLYLARTRASAAQDLRNRKREQKESHP